MQCRSYNACLWCALSLSLSLSTIKDANEEAIFAIFIGKCVNTENNHTDDLYTVRTCSASGA